MCRLFLTVSLLLVGGFIVRHTDTCMQRDSMFYVAKCVLESEKCTPEWDSSTVI